MNAVSTPLDRSIRKIRSGNTHTPLRRRSAAHNITPIVPEQSNDEHERSHRRSVASLQKRISSIPQQPNLDTTKPGEEEVQEHFNLCMKMYMENKINVKNVWNLKFIDYMKVLLDSNKNTKDVLKLGSASLDVGAKIYGIRVDDVHANGLRLASNVARIAINKQNDDDPNETGYEVEAADKGKQKVKKKQRRLSMSSKNTIVKDPMSLIGNIPRVESNYFQTGSNPNACGPDNLFTNKLATDRTGCKAILFGELKAWTDPDDEELTYDDKRKVPIVLPTIKNINFFPTLKEFEVDVWDPVQDEKEFGNWNTSHQHSTNDELVFDEQGVPVAELDGSVHNAFDNAVDDRSSEEDEDRCDQIAFRANVANVVDFRPNDKNMSMEPNEYSYHNMSTLSLNSNKFINQLWAGPSHWKFKGLQGATSRFTGTIANNKIKEKCAKKQKRPTDMMINFENPSHTSKFNKEKTYRGKAPTVGSSKIQPQTKKFGDYSDPRSLILRPVNLVPKSENVEPVAEVGPYNYDNPNDSLYCSQAALDDDGVQCDDGIGDDGVGYSSQSTQMRNIGDDLIAQPDLVPFNFIAYATQAKKMNMKKLKIAVWKSLIQDVSSDLITTDALFKKKVHSISFSEVYRNLPKTLPKKMREDLSSPLVFVALLHLCNEQDLKLTRIDASDFQIERHTSH